MFCPNCGNTVADGYDVCPFCSSPLSASKQAEPQQNSYAQPQYPPQQNSYAQPQYQQQPPYAQPQYPPQQPYQSTSADSSTAKTLGIVAIVAAFFVPLVSIICGAIGISKANAVLAYNPADADALSGKKLGKIGIIISVALFVITLLVTILAVVFAMSAGPTYSYYQ